MKVKLIWKFYGPDCVKTANHHLIHLIDFIEENGVEFFENGVDTKKVVHLRHILLCLKKMLIH